MNKQEKIKFFKQQIEICKEMKTIAEQNIAVANRLEKEAKNSLKLLGASDSTQKNKSNYELSDEEKLKLIASLSK